MLNDGHVAENNAGGDNAILTAGRDEIDPSPPVSLHAFVNNERVQDRVVRLQQDCSTLLRERDEEKAEVEALQRKLR